MSEKVAPITLKTAEDTRLFIQEDYAAGHAHEAAGKTCCVVLHHGAERHMLLHAGAWILSRELRRLNWDSHLVLPKSYRPSARWVQRSS